MTTLKSTILTLLVVGSQKSASDAFSPVTTTLPKSVEKSTMKRRLPAVSESPAMRDEQGIDSSSDDFLSSGQLLAGLNNVMPPDALSSTNELLFEGESSLLDTALGSTEQGVNNHDKNDDDIAKELVLDHLADLEAEKAKLDDGLDESSAIGAILAASQVAAEEAESKLTNDGTDSVPLIPMPANNTMGLTDMVEAAAISGTKMDAPDVKKILRFAVPAIGVWLCSPLLSLIDTSAVGLLSGTAQQAALNPAVAVTDYTALLIAFMYTGATNLVAAAQEEDRGLDEKPKASRAFITGIQLSGFVGVALGGFLFIFARHLLTLLIGNDGINPEVFSAAMKYVRIRSLGMPAAAIIGSAQASCLGLQDIKSPLYVLAAAAVVNFLGDMIFVGSSNPILGGAAGAAWATVLSQYTALAFFMRWLLTKPKVAKTVVNLTNPIKELMGDCANGEARRSAFRSSVAAFKPFKTSGLAARFTSFAKRIRNRKAKQAPDPRSVGKSTGFSTRGFLKGKMTAKDMMKFPGRKDAVQFSPYIAPVTATQLGRVSGYVAMSHVVSSSLGTCAMAAQQVVVSLFYCLCPIADSLSLTAQSFVPVIAGKRKSKERAVALKETMFNFMKAGGVFGAAMMGAVMCIPFISKFFTSDTLVIDLVNSVAPYLFGFFSIHGFMCAAEGLLLGQTDLSFLGKMYAAFFAAVPYLMLQVKRSALSGGSASLTSVWQVFTGYQVVRVAAWLIRSWQLQRRTDRDVPAEAVP